MTNQVCLWEWRHSANKIKVHEILDFMRTYTKKYSFQLERGETGYEHFQGAFSLIKKKRKTELLHLFSPEHLQPVATNNSRGFDLYAQKADTRIDGPWTDKDTDKFVPDQYKNLEPRPWQKVIMLHHNLFYTRTIHWVYDEVGNRGKSTVASLMELTTDAIDLPPVNDAQMLIQTLCDILIAKQCRTPGTIFIDLPRCASKDKLYGFLIAVEQIKKGHVMDLRHHYKDWWFNSPQIWIFSNSDIPQSDLSSDRWCRWVFVGDELVHRNLNESSDGARPWDFSPNEDSYESNENATTNSFGSNV